MHFKQWMKLLEAIAPDVKEIILKAKWPASKEEVDKAIKSIEDSPESYDKKQAFSFMQKQFGLKSTEKQTITDPFIQEYKNQEQNKQITTEEFKTLQYFQNGNKELLKEMMDKLRELISTNKITLIFDTKPKIKESNNEILDDYKDLNQFLAIIHKFDQIDLSDKDIQNPAFLELKHSGDLVAKGDNIWVFKGDDPVKCLIMGKGQNWCISSSTSVQHYFNYRHEYGQTQYFIFDFNKDVKDPARYVNPGVAPEGEYSEWVDRRNARANPQNNISFAVNGYPTLQDYLNYLKSKGIDTNLFQADPVSDYERKLQSFINRKDFQGAKNYPDTKKAADGTPAMFHFYLKIIETLDDEDEFDTLTPNQKDEWVINKDKLTGHQANYVISKGTKFLKEYINSINSFKYFLENLQNPDPIIDFIIDNKKDLRDILLKYFFDNTKDFDKTLQKLIERIKKEDTKIQNDIFSELIYALKSETIGIEESIEIAKAIAKHKPNFIGNEIEDILLRIHGLPFEQRIDIIQIIVENLQKYNSSVIDEIFNQLKVVDRQVLEKEKYEKIIDNVTQNITNTSYSASPANNIITLLMKVPTKLIDYTIEKLGDKINLLGTPEIWHAFYLTRKPEILSKIIPKHIVNQLTKGEVFGILNNYLNKGVSLILKDIIQALGKENLEKLEKEKMETLLQNATQSGNIKSFIDQLKNLFPNNNYPNSWKEIEGLQ
jgi:hypothetical protein